MTEKSLTLRSLFIGLIFGGFVAMVNGFLLLTVPVFITAAMISVIALFAFSSLFKASPPSSKEAVTAYTVHKAAAFAFSIFPVAWVFLISYGVPGTTGLRIPDWILPDSTLYRDVLSEGIVVSRSWITPLAWMLPVAVVSGIAALLVVIWLKDHLIEQENLTFPRAQADIELIKSLKIEKYRLDYLFYGLVIGFLFDFLLIYYPSSMALVPQWLQDFSSSIRLLDVTPYLTEVLPGAAFCFVVSVGFLGLGILMSPKSTFNMVGSAVAFYVILSAVLVNREMIGAIGSFSGQWSTFKYPYGLSLSIGLLLTAVLAPLILKAASPLISEGKWTWKPSGKTLAFFGIFCIAVLMLSAVLSMDRFVSVFPLSTGKALLVGLIILAAFVLAVLINVRIAGEAGIEWASQFENMMDSVRRWALSGLGMLGFEGFAISESLRGSWFAAGQMEALKVGKAFDVAPRHQYVSALFGWCFGWLLSTPFIFLIWHFYGIGRGALPMANVQSVAAIMVSFATGKVGTVFNGGFVAAGFIIGIILFFLQKRNLPFVVAAVGIGVFVGPIYVSTFFVGGLIRVIIEKVKGVTFMNEKGRPFSAGLILGGVALAPLVMVVINMLILALGGM
jgi:uncharacterized oligopeptide transporter (OPT) family protein